MVSHDGAKWQKKAASTEKTVEKGKSILHGLKIARLAQGAIYMCVCKREGGR